MADTLVLAKLSDIKATQLKRLLKRRTHALRSGCKELYENKLVKWRAAYNAKPREETRMFPFQNASNLVIPIIAIHTDTLHARVMSAIFKTQPFWLSKLYGDFDARLGGELREAYEEFMCYVGIEPQELDLYRVYNEWTKEIIKYGTSTIKIPWEKTMRDMLIPLAGSAPLEGYSASESDFLPKTMYEGPRPEKLPFDCFGIPASAKTIEAADLKYHRRVMLEHELLERKFSEVYDRVAVDEVLKVPDRTSPIEAKRVEEEDVGNRTIALEHKEWDVYECYLQWRYDQDKYAPRIIATYHERSDQLLRVVYDNFLDEWFIGGRMGTNDDMYHGSGFAEILWYFQEEASEKHNYRNDNQIIANTKVWRVSPDSKLHQGYRVYPGAMLPAEEGEIEPMQHGEISSTSVEEERLTLDLAERRSGVSPPQQGFGAGGPGKRGVYSAMGTLSLLQEGNRRSDLSISDVRDCHVRVGRVVSHQYHIFGRDSEFHKERMKVFGALAPKIADALQKIYEHTMGLPVYASTASVNKEVEKQNDVMLVQIYQRHYMMISQLLAQLQQPGVPPPVKDYALQVIDASNYLMKTITRNFGHDEVDRLIPDPLKKLAEQQQQAASQGGPPNGQPGQQQTQTQPQGPPPGQPRGGPPMAPIPSGTPIQ